MKRLPDARDKDAEEQAFLAECHRTRNRRQHAAQILQDESFFDTALRPAQDVWKTFHNTKWSTPKGDIKGAEILSALRDHLTALQKKQCCYCAKSLLKGGYASPIEHVLSRTDYPRFSLHFWNLAVACERCNRLKRDTPGQIFPANVVDYPEPEAFSEQFHPRLHPFDDHVRFASVASNRFRYTFYVGQSEQGRNLVTALLFRAAQEEALEINDLPLVDSLKAIRECLGKQDVVAVDKIAEFERALMETISQQADRLR